MFCFVLLWRYLKLSDVCHHPHKADSSVGLLGVEVVILSGIKVVLIKILVFSVNLSIFSQAVKLSTSQSVKLSNKSPIFFINDSEKNCMI